MSTPSSAAKESWETKVPFLTSVIIVFMTTEPFDQEIYDLLEATFQAALRIGSNHTPDQIRLMIIASNIEALAKTFLAADDNPEIILDLKQVALGLLGSSDWLSEGSDL